jgi:hypothetical protein
MWFCFQVIKVEAVEKDGVGYSKICMLVIGASQP